MPEPDRQPDSVISSIGSFSGVASLVLAVAGNNLDRLTNLQRWGLAGASAVMLWFFLASLIIHQCRLHSRTYSHGKLLVTLVVGGCVGGGLLLAVMPFFAFGLEGPAVETLSLVLAGSFVFVFLGLAILNLFKP